MAYRNQQSYLAINQILFLIHKLKPYANKTTTNMNLQKQVGNHAKPNNTSWFFYYLTCRKCRFKITENSFRKEFEPFTKELPQDFKKMLTFFNTENLLFDPEKQTTHKVMQAYDEFKKENNDQTKLKTI